MKIKIQSALLILIAVLFLRVFPVCAETENVRPYKMLEWIYYAIAFNSANPEMCYKISPCALDALYFSPAHLSSEYLRSECFYTVAIRSRNKSLCREVKSLSSAGTDNYSESSCLRAVDNNKWMGDGVSFDLDILFKEIGCTKEDLIKSGVEEDDIDHFYLFQSQTNTPSWFKEKIRALPDFSKEN